MSDTAVAEASQTNLLARCAEALAAAERFQEAALGAVAQRIAPGGKTEGALLERHQLAAHGYAWLVTYVSALRQMLRWAERLDGEGGLGELERLILGACYGEYLAQLSGGIALSQGEIVRPADLGLADQPAQRLAAEPAVAALVRGGNTNDARMRIAELISDGISSGSYGNPGLSDETLDMVRDQMHKLADQHREAAHKWHLQDVLIPDQVVGQLAELGVFGLTVPEEFGGLGLGKTAMCVVTEELSRGYIGLGSLGTRSEIAAELIRLGGTESQKARWLPGIAAGEILPTAVFTEPNTGSDLGSLQTRAVRDGALYRVTGNKTWITHAARSDIMTLLARTDPKEKGYRGLSMFIAEKPRGTDGDPFPVRGLSGGEIPVLGYRGMKEYELSFDGFEVKAENLLGEAEGNGFKQLMATFESARIQTAARAVGVAQCALELGLGYALERKQFGKQIVAFPRVAGKLAWMAVETMVARQLSYFAAAQKDSGRRCDIEAGMAKLLAARVAWSNADNALQVHGGNGYAQEYPISRVAVRRARLPLP